MSVQTSLLPAPGHIERPAAPVQIGHTGRRHKHEPSRRPPSTERRCAGATCRAGGPAGVPAIHPATLLPNDSSQSAGAPYTTPMALSTELQSSELDGTLLFRRDSWGVKDFSSSAHRRTFKRWAAGCRQVECSAGREHHGALTACVKRTAEECAGEEALLLAVDALSQAAQSLEQVLLLLLLKLQLVIICQLWTPSARLRRAWNRYCSRPSSDG